MLPRSRVIPLFVSNALSGQKLPLYGDGLQVRNWLYVEDHCLGILHALKKGSAGEIYNISSKTELKNIEITRRILRILNKPVSLIERVKDRLGHDRRYAINSSKLRKLGWLEKYSFDRTFVNTVLWNRDHEEWWKAIKKKKHFIQYYRKAYAGRGSS